MIQVIAWCLWFNFAVCTTEPPPNPPAVAEFVYRGMDNQTTDVEQWWGLASAYFPDETELALCVIKYESGGNPDAYNPSGARGLFQVMGWWAPTFGGTASMLYEPGYNAWVASEIRRLQGWDAWSAYNRGLC